MCRNKSRLGFEVFFDTGFCFSSRTYGIVVLIFSGTRFKGIPLFNFCLSVIFVLLQILFKLQKNLTFNFNYAVTKKYLFGFWVLIFIVFFRTLSLVILWHNLQDLSAANINYSFWQIISPLEIVHLIILTAEVFVYWFLRFYIKNKRWYGCMYGCYFWPL